MGWKLCGCKWGKRKNDGVLKLSVTFREDKKDVCSNWVLFSPPILSCVIGGKCFPLCKYVLNWDRNCVVENKRNNNKKRMEWEWIGHHLHFISLGKKEFILGWDESAIFAGARCKQNDFLQPLFLCLLLIGKWRALFHAYWFLFIADRYLLKSFKPLMLLGIDYSNLLECVVIEADYPLDSKSFWRWNL